ncbi:GIY-YIG nuclease family protein [Sphingomonas sp. SORGH_AS_0879]|uniref:GIY-YIG nuclease family protein n=1 Tax=Sphingomonas sp. SORGH_AS_0879 TaxID=3041790 RepID=UPI0027812B04|nr:GIY-YIG nuclease family protein [Sphingomonas sp. SORGH_AS_0879]MDQ1229550.1 putative endonuclease [Sphingomonas sp. SORGH_AS_0879]
MERPGYVYIMASDRNGTIYLGVTSNLAQRVLQHREGVVDGFTRKHRCHRLVWFEAHESIESARQRELRMKEWKRAWKLREIEGLNPDWDDLYDRIALP